MARGVKAALAAFLLLAGCALLALGLYLGLHGLPGGEPQGAGTRSARPPSFTVLLLGSDARPGEETGRTDTIIVASADGLQGRLAFLSIPRDTLVEIPGHGPDKINAAAVYGGPELTARVVSDLIGLPVRYYVLVRWEGFKNIVDLLGGVTLEVEKDMHYVDHSDGPEYAIDLKRGLQRLDGAQALAYVRFRGDALGDIGRTERQLKFLAALAREAMQPANLARLPGLLPELARQVETNLGPRQLPAMVQAARLFAGGEIVTQTLPGRFLEKNGVSYWEVDPRRARLVARSFFREGRVTEVFTGPAAVGPAPPPAPGSGAAPPVQESPGPQKVPGGA
ncbi:LCP family protein [Desulfovirgula thermocuniculi]|uniref:LCP family protein n=1 Tax=Desulfovirgula thermocuniculi TaxID=348842 RepID=UPI0003F7E8C6|nr:LCP family protein [Desulfovirgula thermocuniculi]